MKTWKIILISVIGFCCLAVWGFKSLIKSIHESKDCSLYVIDNIELRTGIDIPKVIDSNCSFDQVENNKKVEFTLDTSRVNIDSYVSRNKFKMHNEYYVNEGETDNSSWLARMHKDSIVLHVSLTYKSS